MPNIKSAKKRVLINKGKAMENKAAKSALKTQFKKFDAAVAEGNRSEADSAYRAAVKSVDRAAARGLLHRNAAARKKSGMTLKLNKLGD
ncbi:MAG: 30S ribosomal protein S20 [Clostridiales bacterium]|nr:30S ribosomal protein S20 [Clostridiales bacterium]